jgi:Family of unknown function (DUF6092)
VDVSEESPLFGPATYLVASARDCLDGPIAYAALRMVETVSRLVEASGDLPGGRDPFLVRAREQIEAEKHGVMADREQFVAWLDRLLAEFAAEAKRRNLGSAADVEDERVTGEHDLAREA